MVYNPSVDVVKAEKLASTAWELLQRQIVLPRLVNNFNGNDFKGALGDTIKIPVPARTKARRRALRPATEQDRTIQMSSLEESFFNVTITDDLYNAIPIEDEVLTFDIDNVLTRVLAPQVRAVAIDVENLIAEEIENADYKPAFDLELDPAKPYNALVKASTLLKRAYVPMDGRVLLVGSNVEASLLTSDQFIKQSSSGDIATSMLQTATLGTIAGYTAVSCDVIDPDTAYLFHKSAFAFSAVSPVIPRGAAFGQQVGSDAGVPLTWIHDYDFLVSRDRSLVHTYAGTNTFKDQPDANADNSLVAEGGLLRAVRLTQPAQS